MRKLNLDVLWAGEVLKNPSNMNVCINTKKNVESSFDAGNKNFFDKLLFNAIIYDS